MPTMILLVSLFLVAFGNLTFFSQTIAEYPLNPGNLVYLASLAVLLICLNSVLFSLVCFKYTIKPVLIIVLVVSSVCAYFIDTFHVVIDQVMIGNIFETNLDESSDLLSLKLLIYFLLLGLAPSVWIFKTRIEYRGFKKELLSRVLLIVVPVIITASMILGFGSFYASFFREHKPLRLYTNPAHTIYAVGRYLDQFTKAQNVTLQSLALDALIPETDEERELIVLVVGETARADRFSLNGYARKTNPYLEKENLISFTNTWSCGTSTNVSVPCMFSIYDRDDYSVDKANATENILDIIQRAGVNVVWLDNNSDSKGVAKRVPYLSYNSPKTNPDCDIECRDTGMLANLQAYIDQHPQGDIFIVLHQMGNHGPAYYKRYPDTFETFKPSCQSNQLESCSQEEINNAYDNAILYTDYFLSKTIELLKQNQQQFEPTLLYISDHGESLGDNHLYLHGLPYYLAPDEQKRVPMIIWTSETNDDIDLAQLKQKTAYPFSHDNLFHTILSLLEIETEVYDQKKSITGSD